MPGPHHLDDECGCCTGTECPSPDGEVTIEVTGFEDWEDGSNLSVLNGTYSAVLNPSYPKGSFWVFETPDVIRRQGHSDEYTEATSGSFTCQSTFIGLEMILEINSVTCFYFEGSKFTFSNEPWTIDNGGDFSCWYGHLPVTGSAKITWKKTSNNSSNSDQDPLNGSPSANSTDLSSNDNTSLDSPNTSSPDILTGDNVPRDNFTNTILGDNQTAADNLTNILTGDAPQSSGQNEGLGFNPTTGNGFGMGSNAGTGLGPGGANSETGFTGPSPGFGGSSAAEQNFANGVQNAEQNFANGVQNAEQGMQTNGLQSSPGLYTNGLQSSPDLQTNGLQSSPGLYTNGLQSSPDLQTNGLQSSPGLQTNGLQSSPGLQTNGL